MNKYLENDQVKITKLPINGYNLNLKNKKDILLFRDLILPWHFLVHYDLSLNYDPLKNENVENIYTTPHGTLLYHYKTFINMISFLPYTIGKNFIEVGTGSGGFSYVANKAGFNVTCTNYPVSNYEKSCELLKLSPVEFRMGKDSFSQILQNGSKADIIYSYGVPFNRDFLYTTSVNPRDEYWIDSLDYWFSTLDDAMSHLSERGFLFSWHNYRLSQLLAQQLANKLMSKYKCKVIHQFLYKNKIEYTNFTIIKGYNCEINQDKLSKNSVYIQYS